ncbi:hypothetical protein U4U87_23815, partial [Escherichia coli]|nr:hypothetical protein [Escherichia coli]
KRVFLVILFTSFSGSLVSRISGAVQLLQVGAATVPGDHEPFTALKATLQSFTFPMVAGIFH